MGPRLRAAGAVGRRGKNICLNPSSVFSKPRPPDGVFACANDLPPAANRYEARPRVARALLRQKARTAGVDRIKTRSITQHFEAVGQAYRGFGRAEDQITVA